MNPIQSFFVVLGIPLGTAVTLWLMLLQAAGLWTPPPGDEGFKGIIRVFAICFFSGIVTAVMILTLAIIGLVRLIS